MTNSLTADGRIENKVIKYRENGPGAYTILLSRFNGQGHELLSEVGYSGSHMLATLMNAGHMETKSDMHAFPRSFTAADDNSLVSLLSKLERSDELWADIEDGEVFTPDKIEVVLDGRPE